MIFISFGRTCPSLALPTRKEGAPTKVYIACLQYCNITIQSANRIMVQLCPTYQVDCLTTSAMFHWTNWAGENLRRGPFRKSFKHTNTMCKLMGQGWLVSWMQFFSQKYVDDLWTEGVLSGSSGQDIRKRLRFQVTCCNKRHVLCIVLLIFVHPFIWQGHDFIWPFLGRCFFLGPYWIHTTWNERHHRLRRVSLHFPSLRLGIAWFLACIYQDICALRFVR